MNDYEQDENDEISLKLFRARQEAFLVAYDHAMKIVNEGIDRAWVGEEGWDDDLNDEKETSA